MDLLARGGMDCGGNRLHPFGTAAQAVAGTPAFARGPCLSRAETGNFHS